MKRWTIWTIELVLLSLLQIDALASFSSATSGYIAVDTRGAVAASTLIVTVRNGSTGQALSGASVTVNSTTHTTDSYGRCTILSAVNGAQMSITRSGYQSTTASCNVPGAGTYYQTVNLNAVVAAQLPVIRNLSVEPSTALIAPGLNNPVVINVDVNWNNDGVKKLYLSTPKSDKVAYPTVGSYQWRLLPEDIFYDESGTKSISVWAETTAGESGIVRRSVDCLAIPSWMRVLGLSQKTDSDGTREGYWWTYDTGKIPTLGSISDKAKVDLVIVELELKVGSKGELFLGTQGDYDLEAEVNGGLTIKVKDGLPGGISPYGGIEASGGVEIAGKWYPQNVIENGKLAFLVQGKSGVVVPLRAVLLLDPTGAGQGINAFIDRFDMLADWIDENAYVDFWMSKNLAANVPFSVVNDQIQIQYAEFGAGYGAGIKGHLGIGVLYAEAALEGSGMAWIICDPDGIRFDRLEGKLKGYVEVGITVFLVTQKAGSEFEWVMQWPEAEQAGLAALADVADSGDIQQGSLMGRAYASEDYAVFLGQEATREIYETSDGSGISIQGVVTEDTFIQNVFPNTTAALTGSDPQNLCVVYVHDDPAHPQIQGTEIAYSRYESGVWSPPAMIATNTQAEFFPDVALDASNRTVAAWCRVRDTAYSDTNDVVAFIGQFDIIAAHYEDGSGTWSEPQVLNTNAYMNISPEFTKAPSGELSLWWQSNASNQLAGATESTNGAPMEIWWSRWNPVTQEMLNIEPVHTNLAVALSPKLAYNGTNAWLFWVQDLDMDRTTPDDTVVQYRQWSEGVWNETITLSPSNATAANVVSTVLTNGIPLITWWQNGDLLYATGPDFTNAAIARANSSELVMQEYSLAVNATDGNVTLVFPMAQSNSVNLAYRIYDHKADEWGGDFAFVAENAMDFGIKPFYAGDQLTAVYTRRLITYTNETVSIGGSNVVINVPQRDRTDLILARFELDYDLTAVNVRPSETYPPVLYVDVMNSGDLPVSNLVVEVRQDSPVGSLIGRVTNTTHFPPQTIRTFDLPWTGLAEPQSAVVYALVDADNDVSEFLESNNSASNRILTTALDLAAVGYGNRSEEAFEWIATLQNPLARPITNIAVQVHRDATNGTLLAEQNIGSLEAYQTMDCLFEFATTGLTNGTPLITTAAAQQQPGDLSPATTSLPSEYTGVNVVLPDPLSGFRFLRPGLSNEVRFAWNPAGGHADGIFIMRKDDTNEVALVAFATGEDTLYGDIPALSATNIGYQLLTYNADGVSEPTPLAWTNLFADTAGDGLPDDWQTLYFGSTTNANTGYYDDYDGDGIANWMEYLFGSSPADPGSKPSVNLRRLDDGTLELEWPGAELQPYDVLYSTNLIDWLPAESGYLGQDGTNTWVLPETQEGDPNKRFYRINAR